MVLSMSREKIALEGEYVLGWRGRAGLIIPSQVLITEPWFYSVAPRGITFLSSRCLLKDVTKEGLYKFDREIGRAAEELATAGVDVICVCCTAGSFVGGLGYDKKLADEIEEETGVTATTTTTSVVNALKELGIKNFVMTTPYIDEVTKTGVKFFNDSGFNVVKYRGMEIKDLIKIADPTPGEIYNFSKEAWVPEADGLFMSCMQWRAMWAIDPLEKDLRKPVISSDQATLWQILKMMGVREPIMGFGQLLEKHL